jgi:hypothetical protein
MLEQSGQASRELGSTKAGHDEMRTMSVSLAWGWGGGLRAHSRRGSGCGWGRVLGDSGKSRGRRSPENCRSRSDDA